MKATIIALFITVSFQTRWAQQFINKATIEFEVKKSILKDMGNNMWDEMMKENLPPFKISYFHFTFSNNKSIYKFDHLDEKVKLPDFMKREEEENEWYSNYTTNLYEMKKGLMGSPFYVKDSLQSIQWKITNERMVIAGFNCRKAVSKIFDSVYVFAFYTDEIMISGGPCTINGLPGMILGMTIPRLFTSWIATKVMINEVNEAAIKPSSTKKAFPNKEFRNLLAERSKDWEEYYKDDKSVINRFLWNALL
jgi:GLPGLI family protein